MARQLQKLTARGVQCLSEPGRHSDGGGLYLVVETKLDAAGKKYASKRWAFIYRRKRDGKQTEMGLGGLSAVSLARARELAADARSMLADAKDPLLTRRTEQTAARTVPTFEAFAEEVIQSLETGWLNAKHRDQWRSTLNTYCSGLLKKPVDVIETADVLEALKPIWTTKAETATRVRGRIEKILDAAKAKKLRSGENPARWKGNLDSLLGKRQKLQRGHHPALKYKDLPSFMEQLRVKDGMAALALEFVILTAARTGEAIGAQWSEIDLEAKIWTVPAQRMKAGREHRVPLSAPAVALLKKLAKAKTGPFIFPAGKGDGHLSEMALLMMLRRMEVANVTVHGFRSTFRDWCGEATNFPRELAEEALAHKVGDAVERAYRRGDALEKRRALMESWATYCQPKRKNVLPLSRPA
jgi:integrase